MVLGKLNLLYTMNAQSKFIDLLELASSHFCYLPLQSASSTPHHSSTSFSFDLLSTNLLLANCKRGDIG